MRTLPILLGLVLLATPIGIACGVPSSAETGTDEGALTASWFAQNLPEGTPLARAVLAIANDRRMTVDEYVDQVQITRESALALTGYREGDELADTGDDETFNTLTELDAVPFTNLTFWNAMIAYAKRTGVPSEGGIRDAGPPHRDAGPPHRDAGPPHRDAGPPPVTIRDASPIRD